MPIIQRHRASDILLGDDLSLRSWPRTNPLAPNHPVVLATRRASAVIRMGDDCGLTGTTIVAAEEVVLGNRVLIGANVTLADTDFHPLTPEGRARDINAGTHAPIRIGDGVFIGTNSLILKGVTIGPGSVVGAAYWMGQRPGVHAEQEIFHGVWYETAMMPESSQASGLVHVVRVDLRAEGTSLYATPVDSSVLPAGDQYRLQFPSRVRRQENLAVTVNGTFFEERGWIYWPGARTRSIHTVVADGEVNHVHPHSYLIWKDTAGQLHLEQQKLPAEDVLDRAVWGIGGGAAVLRNGVPCSDTRTKRNRRTMIATDKTGRHLFLAVFEHASYQTAATFLASRGASDGIMLDGGGSSAMVVSPEAATSQTGTVARGWRPMATHVGVFAEPLE